MVSALNIVMVSVVRILVIKKFEGFGKSFECIKLPYMLYQKAQLLNVSADEATIRERPLFKSGVY